MPQVIFDDVPQRQSLLTWRYPDIFEFAFVNVFDEVNEVQVVKLPEIQQRTPALILIMVDAHKILLLVEWKFYLVVDLQAHEPLMIV